jgi:hypothetical protein
MYNNVAILFNFARILATANLLKHLILALSFLTSLFGYI